jgi:predicted metal-dependent enzyme (double-stranded beta helix superfamily)
MELSMIAVEYPPGSADPVHTHHAQALIYVLEGSIVMQVKVRHPSHWCRVRPSMKGRTMCTSSAETRAARRRPGSWCSW